MGKYRSGSSSHSRSGSGIMLGAKGLHALATRGRKMFRSGSSARSSSGTRAHVKKKRLVTRTKTKTKSKSRTRDVVEAVHGEITRHSYTFLGESHEPPPKQGPWKFVDQYAYRLGSNEGQQGVSTVTLIATQSQLITTSGVAYTPNTQAQYSLFDSNPTQLATGSAVGGLFPASVQGTGPPPDDRVMLDYVELKIRFSNLDTASPMYLEIVVYQYKKTYGNYAEAEWNAILASQAGGNAAATQAISGFRGTVGYANNNILDERPFHLKTWRKFFKVLHIKKYDLASGAQLINTYRFNYHKMVERKWISDQPAAQVGGLTCGIMAIFNGGVADDITGTKTCSIASTALGAVVTRTVCAHTPNQARFTLENVIPNLLTGSTLANQQVPSVVDTLTSILQA
nr:MAG: capsid protein [Cressdnaviricota sp.]